MIYYEFCNYIKNQKNEKDSKRRSTPRNSSPGGALAILLVSYALEKLNIQKQMTLKEKTLDNYLNQIPN